MADNSNRPAQDTVASAAVDWAQFIAFVGAVIAGRETIASFGNWSAEALRRAYGRGALWYHHSFTAHMRKWLTLAFWVNAAFIALTATYAAFLVGLSPRLEPSAVSVTILVVWGALSAALICVIAHRRWESELKNVKPLPKSELDSFLALGALHLDRLHQHLDTHVPNMVGEDRLKELIELTGLDRNRLRELLEAETGEAIDPAAFGSWLELSTRTTAEQVSLLEQKFGKKGQLGAGTASLIVLSYGANALLILGLASALSVCDADWFGFWGGPRWWELSGLLILGVALCFICAIAVLGTALAGVAIAKNVISYVGAFLKAAWNIVFSAAPFLQGNEAMDLLPDVKLGEVFQLFKTVAGTLPGKFLIGSMALFLSFLHPIFWFVAVGTFIAIGFGGLTAQSFGNDITESMKATGRFIAGGVVLVMGVFHCVQFLSDVGWFHGLYLWLDANGIFYWWNTFAGMGVCAYIGLLIVLVPLMYAIAKAMPSEGKWMKRIKYGLMGLAGLVLVAASIGQIAHLGGADSTIGQHRPTDPTIGDRIATWFEDLGDWLNSDHSERAGRRSTTSGSRSTSSALTAPAPRSTAVPSRRPAPARHRSLGVTHHVPPIPADARRVEVASGDLPSCLDMNPFATPEYLELARRRRRCR